MAIFEYIDTQAQLDELIQGYQQASALMVDTEFVRERTYYAQLGLIQLYDGQRLALIDPCSKLNLDAFWALMVNPAIVKVFHAPSEDLEIIARVGQCQPTPLFDTQSAAAMAGYGFGAGYAKLVEQILDIQLDKGESRTNWLARPLSDKQLNYAALDVLHLWDIYHKLKDDLSNKDRLEWAFEEGLTMHKSLTPIDIEQSYLKVKGAKSLNIKALCRLRALAKWRLPLAIEKDIALGFVLKDATMVALAKTGPLTMENLLAVEALSPQDKRRYARELLTVIKKTEYDNPPPPLESYTLKSWYKPAFKAIKLTLETLCHAADIQLELVGSKRHIHQYLDWRLGLTDEKPVLLKGWRAQFCQGPLDALSLTLPPTARR